MPRPKKNRKSKGTGVYNNATGEELSPEELKEIEDGGSLARRMADQGSEMSDEEAKRNDAQPWPL